MNKSQNIYLHQQLVSNSHQWQHHQHRQKQCYEIIQQMIDFLFLFPPLFQAKPGQREVAGEWDSITLLFTTNLDTLPGKLQLYYIWGASQVKCCILPHSLIQLPSCSSAHPLPAGSYNKHSSAQQRNLPSVLLSDWTPSVLVLAFCSLLNYTHSVSNTRITSGDTHIPRPGQTKPPESTVLLVR